MAENDDRERLDGRRVRGDRNRARILEVSLTVASAGGLEALTFGGVASAAAVPKSSLQTLFGDRLTLQRETLRMGAARFEAAVGRAVRPSETHIGKLAAMVEAWFEVLAGKSLPGGCLVTAAAGEYRFRAGELREAIVAHRANWRSVLLERANAARASGELREDLDPEDLVFDIMAAQSVANVAISDDGQADFERARRRARTYVNAAAASG